MGCFKSTITNNLSQISVYQYKRCSDAAFISNVELKPNQTVDVWYIDDSLITPFQSQIISNNRSVIDSGVLFSRIWPVLEEVPFKPWRGETEAKSFEN
ncbi:MAG: hypothetical protein WCJ72_11640 [Chryseobacterium sp.]